MKTLNIHAGISDKDIIDFMEGKTKDNGINLVEEIHEEKNYKKIIEELENSIKSIDEDITKSKEETQEQFQIRKENKIKELQILYEQKFLENMNKEYPDEEYEKDMIACLNNKKMKFMKDNFPMMFQKDKFYLFLKRIK